MEINTWWALIERARTVAGSDDRNSADDPLPPALTEVLTTLSPSELVDFDVTLTKVTDEAYLHPLWLAADLIEGGCGDDGFMDFRDGLVLQGRAAFTRAIADPDTLADLPVVQLMAADDGGWLGYESISYLVERAYRQVKGETASLTAALETAHDELTRPEKATGEKWDPADDDQVRRHLPRLADLFLS